MHKTKIDWADATWNPITGCLHQCPYCYARQITKRFSGDVRMNLSAEGRYHRHEEKEDLLVLEKPFPTRQNRSLAYPFGFLPTYHKYRMIDLDKWKNGVNIFVCSMADLFGEWVPEEWILEIFQECLKHPQHNYLFLTKNPTKYEDLQEKNLLPKNDNFWYGSTVTDNQQSTYFSSAEHNCFLSLEPLLEDIENFDIEWIDWVIVGAQSGNEKSIIKPKNEWVEKIDIYCKVRKIPLFMKDSLAELMIGGYRTEFPASLKSKRPSQKLSANCMECGQNQRKGEMTTVSLRKGRGGTNRSVGFICDHCLPLLQERWQHYQ